MPNIDLSKLSNWEYRCTFNDWLNYYVRKTFKPNERLMFVTYQPKELVLDFKKVADYTHSLFKSYRYIEVLEQTYLIKNLNKNGHLIDGYHSHILISESDYKDVKEKIKNLKIDVVAKFTYDLSGLTEGYLLKQAGQTINRILPTQNIPIPVPQLITETITVTAIKIIKLKFKPVINYVIEIFQNALIKRAVTTNKIKVALRFIDDT